MKRDIQNGMKLVNVASVCNNKQRQNEDKCGCECKELIDKGVCNKYLFLLHNWKDQL